MPHLTWGDTGLHKEKTMQTKAEQIEELKAAEAKIQKQIEALEKPTQWEPRNGDYCVIGTGNIFNGNILSLLPTKAHRGFPHLSDQESTFGTARQTQEAAEKASDTMRTHNRLLAYVDEFGGDWVADNGLHCYKQNKYYIVYDNTTGEWDLDYHHRMCSVGTVYMSQECAEGLLKKLNSGEVVL